MGFNRRTVNFNRAAIRILVSAADTGALAAARRFYGRSDDTDLCIVFGTRFVAAADARAVIASDRIYKTVFNSDIFVLSLLSAADTGAQISALGDDNTVFDIDRA